MSVMSKIEHSRFPSKGVEEASGNVVAIIAVGLPQDRLLVFSRPTASECYHGHLPAEQLSFSSDYRPPNSVLIGLPQDRVLILVMAKHDVDTNLRSITTKADVQIG